MHNSRFVVTRTADKSRFLGSVPRCLLIQTTTDWLKRPADSYMLHVALEALHRYALALNPRLPSSLYTPNTNSIHHHEVSLPTLSAFLLLAHTALCQYHHIVSDRCWLPSWQRTLLGLLSRQVLVMALDTSFALTSKGGRSRASCSPTVLCLCSQPSRGV